MQDTFFLLGSLMSDYVLPVAAILVSLYIGVHVTKRLGREQDQRQLFA
jgi:hypothetical protein